MNKKYYILIFSVAILLYNKSLSQNNTPINYHQHIAPIMQKHCIACHKTGGIAPFQLTNYTSVADKAYVIRSVTESKYMPPWKPDPHCSNIPFIGKNTLNKQEIDLIQKWIGLGLPEGHLQTPITKVIYSKEIKYDTTFCMEEYFIHKGDNTDANYVFVFKDVFHENTKIAAIEFVPDNTNIVHHCFIGYDTSLLARQLDQNSKQYGYNSDRKGDGSGLFGKESNRIPIIGTWVPGNYNFVLPYNFYIEVPAADILVGVHYGPTPINQKDKSCVKLKMANPKANRKVNIFHMAKKNLRNKKFEIPPNEKKEFFIEKKINRDISLLGVFPHMHKVGTLIEVVAATPNKDTISLIKISDWDSRWQSFYYYEKLLKIPAGSTIIAKGFYNNTSDNPYNPNNPIRTIIWGGSNDEMLLLELMCTNYQSCDEFRMLNTLPETEAIDLIANSLSLHQVSDNRQLITTCNCQLSKFNIVIYNTNGDILLNKNTDTNTPVDLTNTKLKNGIYFINITQGKNTVTKKILLT